MSSKKLKVKATTAKAKATANTNIKINIGDKVAKRKSKPRARKALPSAQSAQLYTSPTIYNPAPTPFYVQSQKQPEPFSLAKEIEQEFRRFRNANIANSVQERDILSLPRTELPTGAFDVSPQFNNMEVPLSSVTELEIEPVISLEKRGRPKGADPVVEEEKRKTREILDGMGIRYGKKDSLVKLQLKVQNALLEQQNPKKFV